MLMMWNILSGMLLIGNSLCLEQIVLTKQSNWATRHLELAQINMRAHLTDQ